MSVEILIIPLALLVKALLTKDSYEEMIETNEVMEKRAFAMKFSDPVILKKTLDEYGVPYKVSGTTFLIEQERMSITLHMHESGKYVAYVDADVDMECLKNELYRIDDEYRMHVQDFVYQDVKNNIEQMKKENTNIEIIDEYIDEDESIVLRVGL